MPVQECLLPTTCVGSFAVCANRSPDCPNHVSPQHKPAHYHVIGRGRPGALAARTHYTNYVELQRITAITRAIVAPRLLYCNYRERGVAARGLTPPR